MFYGCSSQRELMSHIRRACDVISQRNVPVGVKMLSETCAAETGLCTAVDKYEPEGRGAFQFDSEGFKDTKSRFIGHYPEITDKILRELGINWASVEFEMLEYAPLLGAVFCRAKYYLVPYPIPLTRQGRAEYWKKWYNSTAGKGTPEHYMDMSARYLGDDVEL